MKLKIHITEDDIKKGKKKDTNYCPIALAIKRVCPKLTRVTVDTDTCLVIDGKTLFCDDKRIYDFIFKFDDGHKVYPQELDLKFVSL